jgi:uncharacterized protein with HEPN domain
MKHQREYIDYLLDIRDAIEKIENFTERMDYDRFAKPLIEEMIKGKG